VIGYEYSDKGELVSISIDGTPFIKNIKTNDNGLLSYEYADGSKHTREYDTNGRVTKLNYPNYTEEINYNVVSNITAITADSIKRIFDYDNLDRLTSYEQNAIDFQNFVYDANGNRLNQNQENNSTSIFTYAQNSNILNSMVESNTTESKTINYEYDATGNIIKDDKHTYTYDSRNRLTAIDSNVTYQYNYDNKRVSKTVNGVKTYFIYNGHILVEEYKLNLSDDSRQEYVYLNSTPIATMTATEMGRVYADHLDTSRRVAINDSDAQIVWKWESKPFGESKAIGEITFNLRFPGQYFDAETGTHYNINRDYNPVTGRYIQSDPIGFDGGVNGFGYVGGNSLKNIDTDGLVDINYLPYQWLFSSLYQTAKRFNSSWFTVAAHGHDYGAMDYANQYEVTEEGLTKIAKKAKISGKPGIWLLVCYGGIGEKRYKYNGKLVSLPEYLRKKSGKHVKATSGYVVLGGYVTVPYPVNGWKIWR